MRIERSYSEIKGEVISADKDEGQLCMRKYGDNNKYEW